MWSNRTTDSFRVTCAVLDCIGEPALWLADGAVLLHANAAFLKSYQLQPLVASPSDKNGLPILPQLLGLYAIKDGGSIPLELVGRNDQTHICRVRCVFSEPGNVVALVTECEESPEPPGFQQRYTALVEQSPLSVQIFDTAGNTIQVNRAWEELWGLTAEQVKTYNVLQDPQLELKGIAPYIRRAFAGEAVAIPAILYETDKTIPDLAETSARRWVSAHMYPIKDATGQVRELVLIHQNITDLVESEASRARAEELLGVALDAARLGVWDWDVRSGALHWTGHLEAIHGMAPGEFDGSFAAYLNAVHPEDRERVLAEINQTLAIGTEYYAEFRIAGDETRWVAGQGRVFRDSAGQPTRMVGVGLDISVRKANEKALRESEERFRLVFERTMDAIVIADDEGRFLEANRGASELFGRSIEEVLTLSVGDLISTDGSSTHERYLAYRDNGSESGEFTFLRPNGDVRTAEYRASRVAPGMHLSVLRDITERKRRDAVRTEYYEKQARIAETLQRALLASVDCPLSDIDIATEYQSAWDEASVGGDFYDAFPIDDNRLALIIGDITGKGLQAASEAAEVKYSLRAFLRENADPATALSRLNNMLCSAAAFSASHNPYSFAALSLTVIDQRTGEIAMAVAGGEAPLIVRNTSSVDEVQASGILLGIMPNVAFQVASDRLEPGDVLIMVTDGLTEARRSNVFLRREGLISIIADTGVSSLKELTGELLRRTTEYAGGRLQDDACILAAMRRPSGKRESR